MDLTPQEKFVFRLYSKDIDVKSFEQWVYSESALEETLSSKDYLELISIDFKSQQALYDSKKLLIKYFSNDQYYEWDLKMVLENIILRPKNVHFYISRCYDLYCDGLSFLQDIGLNYGLSIEYLPSLEPNEQTRLIDSFYPKISSKAQLILNFLDTKKIIIKGDMYSTPSRSFIDLRTVSEKSSTQINSTTT